MGQSQASATLFHFHRICGGFNPKQCVRVVPGFSRKFGTQFSFHKRHRNPGFRFIASSSIGNNGGIADISDVDNKLPTTYTWPDKKRPRVCILGGGFGGLYTALRLESLVWPDDKKPQVLLVDQSERFVFKPMLYELLSGEVDAWEIAPRFTDLLANTDVKFFQERVKLLYPMDNLGVNGPSGSGPGGTVQLESGLLIEYDWYEPSHLSLFLLFNLEDHTTLRRLGRWDHYVNVKLLSGSSPDAGFPYASLMMLML